MNPPWGPKIGCWIVVVGFEELISKRSSHDRIFLHRDVLKNVLRVETQYAVRPALVYPGDEAINFPT